MAEQVELEMAERVELEMAERVEESDFGSLSSNTDLQNRTTREQGDLPNLRVQV